MRDPPVLRVRNAQRKLRVDIGKLQQFGTCALRHCLELPAAQALELREITVVLVSDRRIAALHKKFMRIVGPTDVLTFQHGEIVMSVETAQQNAERFSTSKEEEIRLYLVHGLLHLLGFDDQTPEQARAMESAQRRILLAA